MDLGRLDTTARDEMAAELATHADNLRRLRPGNGKAFAEEVDRHLDRVTEILQAHAKRLELAGA